MVRHLSDREDLLAEGVNMHERGRVTELATDREWIVGWRDRTAASLFDGVDPVFQFNTSGHLRRVFLDGQKLAANQGGLTRLTRLRDSSGRMTHELHVLSNEERTHVLQRLTASTSALALVLPGNQAKIETMGIASDVFLERLQSWLADMKCVEVAHGPGVVG